MLKILNENTKKIRHTKQYGMSYFFFFAPQRLCGIFFSLCLSVFVGFNFLSAFAGFILLSLCGLPLLCALASLREIISFYAENNILIYFLPT